MKKSTTPPSRTIRLNKFLADAGIASRRKADELIESGAVQINGKRVFELGQKVDPTRDRVIVNGKSVKPVEDKVYVIFHKPKNVVTSMNDPLGRPSVADFFHKFPVRIFPVGRLDWDTEGLLLLTNDGEFAQMVSHPTGEVTKTYLAKLDGQITPAKMEKLKRGVSIIGGKVAAKSIEKVQKGGKDKDWVRIVITEGKNRQVRRMFEKVGHDVLKLQRVAIGRLPLGNLKRGEFRILTPRTLEKVFTADVRDIRTPSRPQSPKRGPNRPKKSPKKSQQNRRKPASPFAE